jgi:CHAT domain-containing protein
MTRERATESSFKKEAEAYNIIHLGTHTDVNSVSPLYSKLVLSKEAGKEDGYLHAFEIYEMELQAELAVLTACETGIGQQMSSEGVMSLAHSFSYAGCPSVVMSLWKIDEKTSSEITESFYENLAEGQSKSRALRNAKLSYLKQASPEESMPYYWAGLVLVGDESAVQLESAMSTWSIILLILLMLTGAFILFKWNQSRTD